MYYNHIVERCTNVFTRIDQYNELNSALQDLSLDRTSTKSLYLPSQARNRNVQVENERLIARELPKFLLALRKLREAIVASSRVDAFARTAYIFIVRITITLEHMESYHPALLHLLQVIHLSSALSSTELHEFVGYQVLDLACRQGDLAAAYTVRNAYNYRDTMVDMILQALVHDHWFLFWKARRLGNQYQLHLTQWAEDRMREKAIHCLGRSYLTADKGFIEQATCRSWDELQAKDGVHWKLNGSTAIIRRIKPK